MRLVTDSTKTMVSRTDIELVQRKVSFDFTESPLHWIPDDPYSSHFISTIHTLLPAGEFFFCRLYNKALPYIQDEKLKEDVKGFIKQEATHARAHTVGISVYLEQQGMEVASFVSRVEWLFEQLLNDKPLGRELPKFMQKRWLVFRLGLIAGLEHFTCVLGKYVLENDAWDKSGADATILDILRWHGAEEIEHRCVAYDVYRHMGGNYSARYLQLALVVPLLLGFWFQGASHLMQQDTAFEGKSMKLRNVHFWRIWQKQAKTTEHLPTLLWLLKEASSYLSPSYDPANEADTGQAQAYLKASPAALRAEHQTTAQVA